MDKKYSGKYLLTNSPFVKCPYCTISNQKYTYIPINHLKSHKKTMDDLLEEFPDYPTMTYNKYLSLIDNGKKINKKENSLKTKKVKCYFLNDGDCSDIEYEVNFYSRNIFICDECKQLNKDKSFKDKIEESKVKRKETLLNKYGVENPQQIKEVKDKTNKTNLEKYNGAGFASSEIKEKVKSKLLEKYDTDNYMKTEEAKQKFSGENHPIFKNPDIKRKISESHLGRDSKLKNKKYEEILGEIRSKELKDKKSITVLNKFIVKFDILLKEEKLEFLDEKYLGSDNIHKFKCTKCDTEFYNSWYNIYSKNQKCSVCYPKTSNTSLKEKEVLEFLKLILPENTEIIENDRNTISPKELDIHIPSRNIAIEYNGLYWHSEEYVDKHYHIDKLNKCKEKNIRLISIFEDEWIFKKDLVKNKLKHLLNISDERIKIHGRKCIIKEIDYKIKNDFLDKYHIQGKDISRVSLGAFYNNELVAVMTFSYGNRSKGSHKQDHIFELNRFATDDKYIIPGIAGKLLNYFKKNYIWLEIFSYADLRWSNGDLYYKLGFECDNLKRLNYWYVKNGIRYHRYILRKTENDPKEISEKKLRLMEGFKLIWDCGNLKFTMKNNLFKGD